MQAKLSFVWHTCKPQCLLCFLAQTQSKVEELEKREKNKDSGVRRKEEEEKEEERERIRKKIS